MASSPNHSKRKIVKRSIVKFDKNKTSRSKPKISKDLSRKIGKRLKHILPDPPFKLRIDKDVLAVLREEISREDLSNRYLIAAIRGNLNWMTDRKWYHYAMLKSNFRNGLNGEKQRILRSHQLFAKKRLYELTKNKK